MATNAQARLPATADFDAKLSKMYDKALKEVQRHLRQSVTDLNLDINKILLPTTDEAQNKKLARRFAKKRLKILDSMDTLVRGLIIGRNRVSLFDMFDENKPMGRRYARRYNRVKMQALNRLETGVSLIKFERQQNMPLATILFPSRNSKLYAARYELLKQQMITKVSKGVKNLSFVADTWRGRMRKRFKLERNKAEVPISAFLIPTPNTNLFAMRYNFAKHRMLSKVNKGIKNLQFVALTAEKKTNKHGDVVKTKLKPITTKVDVPIDQFLMPSGNTWYYAARYELAKLKLLKKVRQGINNVTFTGGEYDILEKFMPNDNNSEGVNNTIGKSIAKAVNRESKSRTKSNEYVVHKTQKREDRRLKLDEERNKILKMSVFGKSSSSGIMDMKQGKDGVWKKKSSVLSSNIGAGVSSAMITNGAKIARVMGPVLGVAAAGAIGYGIGTIIDKKFDLSGKGADAIDKLRQNKIDKKHVEAGLKKNADTQMFYRELTGGSDKNMSAKEKRRIFEEAQDKAFRRMETRKNEFIAAGYDDWTVSDLRSLKPTSFIKKTALNEPIEYNPIQLPPGMQDGFTQGGNNNSVPIEAFNILIDETKKGNALLQNVQGTKIINPRPNADFNLSQNLDFYITR